MQLLELLEIPQLMDTCVRNKMYKEALDLTTFANVLETRHLLGQSAQNKMSSSRIIADIVKDVRRLALQMRGHLLDILSSDVQLPTCLKARDYCAFICDNAYHPCIRQRLPPVHTTMPTTHAYDNAYYPCI